MSRSIRIIREGAWYHLSDRGNEQKAIFRDDRDRRHFCELLAEVVSRFNVALHAYVLMDNHYHLLLELRELNLSRAMQWLNLSYSVWFNRRWERSGHLFQGRYHSVIVEAPVWALGLSRYLHLNPVRTEKFGLGKMEQQQMRAGAKGAPEATLVRERLAYLRAYRWSSYRAYIGLAKVPDWLECRAVSKFGGGSAGEARKKYREYVEAAVREGLSQSPWEELRERVVLGSQEFLAGLREHLSGDEREQRGLRRLREARPDLEAVIRSVEALKGEKWEAFCDRHGDDGRDLVLYLGRKVCGLRLNALADRIGVKEYTTVAMAVKRFEGRLNRKPSLQAECRRVAQMLNVKM